VGSALPELGVVAVIEGAKDLDAQGIGVLAKLFGLWVRRL